MNAVGLLDAPSCRADEGTVAPPVSILIVYDARPAALRARELVQRIGWALGESRDVAYGFWRTDVLGFAEVRNEAEKDARRADVIILSLSRLGHLTRQVKEWLAACVDEAAPEPKAFVALFENPADAEKFEPPIASSAPLFAAGDGFMMRHIEGSGQRSPGIRSAESEFRVGAANRLDRLAGAGSRQDNGPLHLAPSALKESLERVARAKRLLLNPRFSIAEIAEDLGHESPERFEEDFEIFAGLRPEEYQDRVRRAIDFSRPAGE